MKKIFYDLETTGTDPRRHSIHQLSASIEIDGQVKEVLDLRIRPHEKSEIVPEALAASGVTLEQLQAHPLSYAEAFKLLEKTLARYVDAYDKTDKFHLVGFNNLGFDDNFLIKFFKVNGSSYFFSWFWSDRQDVQALASVYLQERRRFMPSFKLSRVAKELGIEVDDSRLHEAGYDVVLTRSIYRVVTGLDAEPNEEKYFYWCDSLTGVPFKSIVYQEGADQGMQIKYKDFRGLLAQQNRGDGDDLIIDPVNGIF